MKIQNTKTTRQAGHSKCHYTCFHLTPFPSLLAIKIVLYCTLRLNFEQQLQIQLVSDLQSSLSVFPFHLRRSHETLLKETYESMQE